MTVLQADEEMDAGDIFWSTKNFLVPQDTTKSSKYGSLVVDAAMDANHEAMKKFVIGETGTPLNYSDPNVNGTLRHNMKITDRQVDFHVNATDVTSTIRFSDSSPGASHTIEGHKVFLYDAHVDNTLLPAGTTPRTLIEKRHGAVRLACAEGSVWVTHMKGRGKDSILPCIKLPSTMIIPQDLTLQLPEHSQPNLIFDNKHVKAKLCGWQDTWAYVSDSARCSSYLLHVLE
jgi:putative two-component system hydrogenase maturation factor HypX/HoxX